jgi:DNA ligase-1
LFFPEGIRVDFAVVSHHFEQINQVSSRLAITQHLADLLKQASPGEAEIICNLSLGQLHAPYLGTQFNVAEKTLIRVVAHLLDISQESTQAKANVAGDLGLLIEEGIWQVKEPLSIKDVYKALCELEAIEGTGSQEEKSSKLTHLLKSLDPVSAKYVARIVLGKLRLGFSDMTIVDALSWMETGNKSLRDAIEDAYNICADIGLIAKTIKAEGIEAIKKMHAQVGIPIRPAAAERLPTAKAIYEKLGDCVAQPKLDGFRLQIHLDKTGKTAVIKFFSRNLQDMSQMFPDLVDEIAKLDVQTMICEGEAITFDQNTGSFLPFQETVKRKRKHGIEEAAQEYPLQVLLFDILYLNGKDLLNESHEARRTKLKSVIKNGTTDMVRLTDEKLIKNAKDLEEYFDENITSGLEGLVVKRPDALYQPGKRNFNWIKLKRQEEGHLEDTLDTVILGYYFGEGKRAHFGIGAFLVGVYNKAYDAFQTVAKIGTGLKDPDWKELKKKCDELKIKEKPRNVECDKNLYPDVWCSPEIVCMVRADEITLSPVHAAGKTDTNLGFALRFPRFMGYRPDKSAKETTTVTELKRLYDDQYQK